MAAYHVVANGTRDFQLLDDNTEALGTLHYSEWFSFKAVITLADGSTFQVAPRGAWGTTIEVRKQDTVLLNFKMHWSGDIIIKSKFNQKAFVFKQQSLLKNRYVLQDEDKDKQELLTIQPDFQWSKLNHNYTLSATSEFEALEHSALLLLTIIHCANYYMTMMAGMTGAMVAIT